MSSLESQSQHIVRLSDLSDNALTSLNISGNPEVALQLSLLRSTVEPLVRDQIGVNIDRMASIARWGGIKTIRLALQQAQEQLRTQGGHREGNAMSVAGANVRRITLEPTLDEESIFNQRRKDWNEQWGSGEIPLDRQAMAQEVGRRSKRGVRDEKMWAQVLNRELLQGLTKLSAKHLTEFNAQHGQHFILENFIFIAGVALAATIPPKTPLLPTAIIGYFAWKALDVLRSYRAHIPRRLSEFLSNGPEFIRAGMMKSINILARIPKLRDNFQIIVPLNPQEATLKE